MHLLPTQLKRTLFLVAFLTGFSLQALQAHEGETNARKNVLEYYRSLKGDYAPGYRLFQKAGKWYTESTAEYELEVVVDLRNGFINIVDEGTGGGTTEVRVVLFRLSNGQAMIAVTKSFFDGTMAEQSAYFLRPDDPKQYDWTEYTLGVVSARDFLAETYQDEPELLEDALPVFIELPQNGTTLTARIRKDLQWFYCKSGQASAEQKAACPAFDQIARETIALKWDRVAGQFKW